MLQGDLSGLYPRALSGARAHVPATFRERGLRLGSVSKTDRGVGQGSMRQVWPRPAQRRCSTDANDNRHGGRHGAAAGVAGFEQWAAVVPGQTYTVTVTQARD